MIRFLTFALLLLALLGFSGCGSSNADTSIAPGPAPPGMVWIPGGTFQMGGSEEEHPDEWPIHEVTLDGFWMDAKEVTNAEFAEFVEATGYVTLIEKKPELRSLKGGGDVKILEEFSKPGSLCLNPSFKPDDIDPSLGKANAYRWWQYTPGADWRHPEGPESSIEDRMDHPVVHLSWLDVKAYCEWAGKDLPTEAEWEYAARGGKKGRKYPWGNDRNPQGKWLNNIWQGEFPFKNTAADGFPTTAPVGSFPPNSFGLYDMSGNVWEWCRDYYRADYYAESPNKNPMGPRSSLDPQEPNVVKRVQRGGSFMCSDSYCIGYRVSARMKGEEDTGAFHTGFRCVIRPRDKATGK